MKVAPILAELEARALSSILVHTGQHYDAALSDAFFRLPCREDRPGRGGGGRQSHAGRGAGTGEYRRR